MNQHGKVREEVSEAYARAVRTPSEGGGSCCAPAQKGVVVKIAGYTREELDALPPEAVINSFGCGNPLAFSEVREGDSPRSRIGRHRHPAGGEESRSGGQ
jgi:hypothetical protein